MSYQKFQWRKVKDQLSQWHELTKELGRGGQGVVYSTSDPELLIKMSLKNGHEIVDPVEVKKFQEKFERLYVLPLTESMHITKPLYLLDERAGYVMQMMQDMQPIGTLLPQRPSKQIAKDFIYPDWLDKKVQIDIAYPLSMYAESGGTKRRLDLLTQATIELLRLHSVGVMFLDVSPDNIFVSSDPNYSEVWLIDADNLRFETPNSQYGVRTPHYGAPEIVKGTDGARTISDAYSWALLAFKILLMTGAFEGQRFYDAKEEVEWDADESENVEFSLDDLAERGELPFILDQEDSTNSHVNGLPPNLVLPPELLIYFQKMFGEGRRQPWKRPSIHFLPRLFAKAADTSIQCECGMSFYYIPTNPTQECPYCGYQPKQIIVATSYLYTEEGAKDLVWRWVSSFTHRDFQLPRRVLGRFNINNHNEPMIEIAQIEQDSFLYVSEEYIRVDILDNKDCFHQLTGQWLLEKQQLKQGVQLYLHAPYSVIIEIKVLDNHAI